MSPIEQIKTGIGEVKDRWNKPDHPVWKTIANWAFIVGAPVGEAIIQIFVPMPYQKIVSVAWATLLSVLKAGSKLTVDPKVK